MRKKNYTGVESLNRRRTLEGWEIVRGRKCAKVRNEMRKMAGVSTFLIGGFLMLCCWTAIANAEEYIIYKDPKQPIHSRIKDLMSRMTLEEKIGQMTQIERKVATHKVLKKYSIGSILSGGGSVPGPQASPEAWVDMVNCYQNSSLSSRLGIPMIYGIDAVHGNNNVYKATIFPHNIGLGATRQQQYCEIFVRKINDMSTFVLLTSKLSRLMVLYSVCVMKSIDPELVKRIGAATAREVRATGIPYAFAPCIAVCRDPRWGRCFESYSEDPTVVRSMTEIIYGLQGDVPPNSPKGVPYLGGQDKVIASAKHYVGDGGTIKGINENNTVATWHQLMSIHMPAYYDSIIKGVSTVMISYSSWNGVKMHANRDLITGFLKNTMRFRGFVISDWEAIDRITSPPHANYTYSILTAVNAGVDMVMVPYNYTEFIDGLTMLEHRELAREAVRKSLVLLKNGKSADQPLLPLPKKTSKILVAGTHADNIGNQCGGWTIEWHGQSGNTTVGTTILTAIKNAVDRKLQFPTAKTRNPNTAQYHKKCLFVGEMRRRFDLGRPIVIEPYLADIDALVAAWLPGSEGQGVTDVLFGDYGFTGKLPITWFKNVDQLPMNKIPSSWKDCVVEADSSVCIGMVRTRNQQAIINWRGGAWTELDEACCYEMFFDLCRGRPEISDETTFNDVLIELACMHFAIHPGFASGACECDEEMEDNPAVNAPDEIDMDDVDARSEVDSE
ncbi:hypothetical protein DH2020_014843 [Rehmannia glutinosa]|uniref:Uncharacterized protein n=1 Tax=Rehmannia glutinosa TaxID=99300 RepID=A0ABR0WZ48_REHGL